MNKQRRIRQEKGITLIALIITIVVLLILAVVTINAIQGDGIIEYASNAADEYTAKADEEQESINTLLGQIEGSLTEKEIAWTKTSEGELAVGSTVKTSTNEEFYVIGFAGTNNETVKLLAKNNLKADGTAQDPTGATNPCAFSTVENLEFTYGENLNNNTIIKSDTTSAVYKAMKYGETLGVTTGRLMLYDEAESLQTTNSDILYGRNGKSSGEYLNYWVGTGSNYSWVWFVFGYYDAPSDNYSRLDSFYYLDTSYSLRSSPSYRNFNI